MGLFNRKKNNDSLNQGNNDSGSLFNDITQNVALEMYSMKMVNQPAMKFLYDDCGIFEGIYNVHTTNPNILRLKSMPNDTYLLVCGMHAFGASIWALKKADGMGKTIDKLNSSEVYGIAQDFGKTDAYELALRAINSLSEPRKSMLDQVIMVALNTLKEKTGSRCMEPGNVRVYMKVLYNAGVTLMLGN